jgi:putative addiction module component (TIGR02574 family)
MIVKERFKGGDAMSTTLTELGIDQMTVDEQIALAEAIWDNIAFTPEKIPLTQSQQQELERRLAAHQADPTKVTPWEVIKAEALARMN